MYGYFATHRIVVVEPQWARLAFYSVTFLAEVEFAVAAIAFCVAKLHNLQSVGRKVAVRAGPVVDDNVASLYGRSYYESSEPILKVLSCLCFGKLLNLFAAVNVGNLVRRNALLPYCDELSRAINLVEWRKCGVEAEIGRIARVGRFNVAGCQSYYA